MITYLRDLCTKDLSLKIFSLALSVLIYSIVSIFAFKTDAPGRAPLPLPTELRSFYTALTNWNAVTRELAMPTELRTFYNLPVIVMSAAADVRQFKVTPEQVAVTVQGDAKVLARLESSEIRALVDLTGIESAKDLRKRIEVSVPAGISQVRVSPAEVRVLPPKR